MVATPIDRLLNYDEPGSILVASAQPNFRLNEFIETAFESDELVTYRGRRRLYRGRSVSDDVVDGRWEEEKEEEADYIRRIRPTTYTEDDPLLV